MITTKQLNEFLSTNTSNVPIPLPSTTLFWQQPVGIRDKLEQKAWTSDRIESARKSLSKNIGVDNLIPPTLVEQQNNLDFWWREEGQFIPRHVLDELGIVGGEKVPTLKESIELDNKQQLNAVKDFLAIERPKGKDPLGDLITIPEPTDLGRGLGGFGAAAFLPPQKEVKPKIQEILKATEIEDLEIIKDTIINSPLEFEGSLFQAVSDEIQIKKTIPDVLEAMKEKPLITMLGTDFFNTIAFGLPEFTSRKGFSPTEALLGLPKGTESIWIRSVARVREMVVAEDPSFLIQLGVESGGLAAELIKFALIPDISKAGVFAALSPAAKGAIGIGTKAGLIELLQAPEVGETFEERVISVAKATGIGALTGAVLSKIITTIRDIPVNKQAAKIIKKFPELKGNEKDVVTILKAIKENRLISLKFQQPIEPARRIAPIGFRTGFAEIEKPAKLVGKAITKGVKVSAKAKEAAIIEAAKVVLQIKAQPSAAVRPVKILTKVEFKSLQESGLVTGEGDKIRIVTDVKIKKLLQTKENEIAKLKTRRNELFAQKQFAVAKTKAQEIAKKEEALAKLKEKAGIKLEQTVEGAKAKITKIREAQEFKASLRDDAVSMVTAIPKELRTGFINRANRVKTLRGLQKLTKEVEEGVKKLERKIAIRDLEDVINKAQSEIDNLPSPQRERLIETIDSISTKKISKELLEGPPREFEELDVKARRGRVQLLGDDLESLQRVTQRLAGELAGQLESLEPEVEEALRLPNERVRQLNLLTQKNANEIEVEDIKFITESLQNTLNEGKLKGKLFTRKGLKPLEGVLKEAPLEVRVTKKTVEREKAIAKGEAVTAKKSKIEKAIEDISKLVILDRMHADTLVEKITIAGAKNIPLILDTLPHKGLRETAETFNAWRKLSSEKFNEIGFTNIDQILGEHTVTLAGVKLKDVTLSELMSLEMDLRSEDNLLQRLNAEGIQIGNRKPLIYEKDIHGEDVVDRLKELKDAVAIVRADKRAMALLEFTEGMNIVQAGVVNPTADLRFGHQIARERNYYPRSRVGDEQVSGPKGKVSSPPEKMGRYQQRTGGTKPLRVRPWHGVFLEGLEADAGFANMTLPLRNARILLNNKDFRNAIKAAGREAELKNLIEIFSNAQGISSSKDIVDNYGNWIIQHRSTSALGFRVSTRGTQILSFYAAQALTGNQGALAVKLYNTDEIARIEEDSALMTLRWLSRRVGIEIGTSASDEAFNLLFFGKTKNLVNKGMVGLVKGDKQAIANIYYQLVIPEISTTARNGKNVNPFEWEGEDVADLPAMKNVDSPEFRFAAARRLEFVSRRSQPAFDMLDRSVALSSRNFFRRSFNMFMTARNAMENTAQRAIIEFQKGLITKTQLTGKLGAVAAAQVSVGLWKRGLKWAIGTTATAVLGLLGIFQFREPKEKTELLKDIAKDSIEGITGLNPFTKIIHTVAELAIDKAIGDDYHWGREPVENPVLEVLNSGGESAVFITQVLVNTGLLDEFIFDPKTKADKEFNEQLSNKIVNDFVTAIKASYNFGTTITGAPLQAPAQEFLSPFFKTSDIAIIREVTFGDVDSPQKFSERVFRLFEKRKELNRKSKKKRLTSDEERILRALDDFVSKTNNVADILKETGEHRIRALRFIAIEMKLKVVEKRIKKLEE